MAEIEEDAALPCTSCGLYDEGKQYCTTLEEDVDDPNEPPCGGELWEQGD